MTTAVPDLLQTVAEPTRLRIINCLAAARLFVSDLQVVLDLPQPTVSRHLQVLRKSGLVRDTPIAQFVLYRLRRAAGPPGKVLGAIVAPMDGDPQFRPERERALVRSRTHTGERTGEPEPDAAGRSRRS